MFTPSSFATRDPIWLDRLIARDAFVTLVTTGPDGLPCVTLLPVLYHRDADGIVIEGHWAKANPQSRHGGPALVLVHGPHGYVSPGWYPDKDSEGRVPTWNYAAAELRGTLETITDRDWLIDLLDRLSIHNESQVGSDWRFDPDDARQAKLLPAIVGFRFRAEQVQIKLKLSQNHPDANQVSVIAALEAEGTPASRELAQWMRDVRDPAAAGG